MASPHPLCPRVGCGVVFWNKAGGGGDTRAVRRHRLDLLSNETPVGMIDCIAPPPSLDKHLTDREQIEPNVLSLALSLTLVKPYPSNFREWLPHPSKTKGTQVTPKPRQV